MKVVITLLAAALTLFGNVLLFQTSDWGISVTEHYYFVRFIEPVVMSFIFAAIATESFANYGKPLKINRRLNPTWGLFVASTIITSIMALFIE